MQHPSHRDDHVRDLFRGWRERGDFLEDLAEAMLEGAAEALGLELGAEDPPPPSHGGAGAPPPPSPPLGSFHPPHPPGGDAEAP